MSDDQQTVYPHARFSEAYQRLVRSTARLPWPVEMLREVIASGHMGADRSTIGWWATMAIAGEQPFHTWFALFLSDVATRREQESRSRSAALVHWRQLDVDQQFLLQFIRPGHLPAVDVIGYPLPEDARVVLAEMTSSGSIRLTVESQSFAPVPLGAPLPMHETPNIKVQQQTMGALLADLIACHAQPTDQWRATPTNYPLKRASIVGMDVHHEGTLALRVESYLYLYQDMTREQLVDLLRAHANDEEEDGRADPR